LQTRREGKKKARGQAVKKKGTTRPLLRGPAKGKKKFQRKRPTPKIFFPPPKKARNKKSKNLPTAANGPPPNNGGEGGGKRRPKKKDSGQSSRGVKQQKKKKTPEIGGAAGPEHWALQDQETPAVHGKISRKKRTPPL